MPFPNQVYVQPGAGVPGDFASLNPRFTYNAGPGALVAGPNGLTIGRFAWVDPSGDGVVNNTGIGPVSGFVGRQGQQALITVYLAESSQVIPGGNPVTLYTGGDFWVINSGAGEALIGQKAYANYSNGAVTFAATGSPGTASGTASSIAAATAISVTGSIIGQLLTVTAVSTGTVVPGAILTGTGVATGTQVTQQLSGTADGIGTYLVNIPDQAVAAGTTIGGTYGILTVGGTITGTFSIGDTLESSTISVQTVIWGFGTGTGGAGTYIVSPSQTAGSTTITAGTTVETKWFAITAGPAGGIVKISSQPLG